MHFITIKSYRFVRLAYREKPTCLRHADDVSFSLSCAVVQGRDSRDLNSQPSMLLTSNLFESCMIFTNIIEIEDEVTMNVI